MAETSNVGVVKPVLIAGAITLLVTLLRFYGETHDWAPKLFSKEPGGAGALIGISWLVIPVGFWLGRRVARAYGRPASMPRAVALAALAIAGFAGGIFFVTWQWPNDFDALGVYLGLGTPIASLLLLAGWPRMFFVNLVYAALARIPVIAVQYYAIGEDLGTHFEKVAPEFGARPPEVRAQMLMQAQLCFWIPFTIIACGVFALLGALTVRRRGA